MTNNNISDIFANKDNFRYEFEQGLVDLLKHDDLGVFILVVANASFDQHVHDYTEGALLTKYHKLREFYRKAIEDGQQLNVPEDDLLVFLKLVSISIDHIKPTQFRYENLWELQFNHIRSLRPARMTQEQVSGISLKFDPNGFNFNKPFLQKEIFWEDEFLGKDLAIFYNKFPFTRFHSLLVPDKIKGLNQFLSAEYHDYIFQVCQELTKTLPGVGIAYNSYGAFASVNHLHFHLYIKEHSLPLMNIKWLHNGGDTVYPIQCEVFNDVNIAWNFIESLNLQHIAYNLIYQENKIYCLVRKHQSEMLSPPWCSGLGWYEACGGFTTFNFEDFNQMQENTLSDVLNELKTSQQKL